MKMLVKMRLYHDDLDLPGMHNIQVSKPWCGRSHSFTYVVFEPRRSARLTDLNVGYLLNSLLYSDLPINLFHSTGILK